MPKRSRIMCRTQRQSVSLVMFISAAVVTLLLLVTFPSSTLGFVPTRRQKLMRPSSFSILPIKEDLHRMSTTAVSLSPQEFIDSAVSLETFAPQFLWLPMIVAPKSELTKKLMGPIQPILLLSVVHLAIVLTAASQEGSLDQILIFQKVFDPAQSQLDGMQELFSYKNFDAEEWPHVLIWDLFVGRMIWLDGLERGIDTRIALSFCNFIGPPGLLSECFKKKTDIKPRTLN
jgi:hypothetical protein